MTQFVMGEKIMPEKTLQVSLSLADHARLIEIQAKVKAQAGFAPPLKMLASRAIEEYHLKLLKPIDHE